MKWRLHQAADFAELAGTWNTLNQAGPNTPLLDARFARACIRYFGSSGEQIAICEADNKVCCMAVIGSLGLGRWQTFQPSQAPLGFWVQTADVPFVELLRSLGRALPGFITAVGVTQQDPELLPVPPRQPDVETMPYIETAFIDLPKSFDEYWSHRGKNLRHNVSRQRNNLKRSGIGLQLEVHDCTDDMESIVRGYGDLEQRGWKATQGTAVSPENAQGRFYEAILSEFSRTNEAMAFTLSLNGQLAACDLCLLRGRTLYVLKTAHDESRKGISSSVLLRYDYLQRIFERIAGGRIEFYGRIMEWHRRWSEQSKVLYHATLRPSFSARMLGFIAAFRSGVGRAQRRLHESSLDDPA